MVLYRLKFILGGSNSSRTILSKRLPRTRSYSILKKLHSIPTPIYNLLLMLTNCSVLFEWRAKRIKETKEIDRQTKKKPNSLHFTIIIGYNHVESFLFPSGKICLDTPSNFNLRKIVNPESRREGVRLKTNKMVE